MNVKKPAIQSEKATKNVQLKIGNANQTELISEHLMKSIIVKWLAKNLKRNYG